MNLPGIRSIFLDESGLDNSVSSSATKPSWRTNNEGL